MHVLSINRGHAEPIANAKASGVTGIYKRPVEQLVWIGTTGLAEDAICDTENHGGVDQAIYVYGLPDYAWWSATLGYELHPGTFGENITIAELESAQLAIGDRLTIGDVILEVTAPRIPCVTLARRMSDPLFVKRFRAAERPGVYCRVINEGYIQSGTSVQYTSYAGVAINVIEMFRDFFTPNLDESTLRRYLGSPIAIRDRQDKEKQLEQLLATT